MPREEHGSEDITVTVDPGDFARLMRAIRGFDKDLSTRTRKALRDAAKPAVADVKKVLLAPTGHRESKTHLRRTLAKGTKVSIRAGQKSPGVTITTSGAKLENPRLARMYNRRSWRHPVFGDRKVWVTQQGRPYFNVIYQHRAEMTQGMRKALDAAVEQIGAAS